MKITRHGSSRFMGYASIDLIKPDISWDSKDGTVHVRSVNVADFSSDASHDYDLSLSLDELTQMLAAALRAVPAPSAAKT